MSDPTTRGTKSASLPTDIRLQIVASAAEPPLGAGWLHEIKHDGHRLVAILDGRGGVRLLSRRSFDRTPLFREPFAALAGAGRAMVLDGEIAVPDDRGVTHLDALTDALAAKRSERLAYYAFDLLHLDGEDWRGRGIEHRKAALADVLAAGAGERVVYVDHVVGRGVELFDRVREIGAEGIVSKRLGSLYRGRESRDWLKTKCHTVGRFFITGFQELGKGRLEAVHVAEEGEDGELRAAGQVRFGLAGRGLWGELDALREGPASRGVVPVPPVLTAEVKFFGRHKGGAIRDGVLLSVSAVRPRWGCDCDETVAAFDARP